MQNTHLPRANLSGNEIRKQNNPKMISRMFVWTSQPRQMKHSQPEN